MINNKSKRDTTDIMTNIKEGKFEAATQILKSELLSARFLDPREDHEWGRYAKAISTCIQLKQGPEKSVLYWKDLAAFFTNDLEPIWGRIHKGTIYFNEGLSLAPQSIDEAKNSFERAKNEDIYTLHERGISKTDAEQEAMQLYAYPMLTILSWAADDTSFYVDQKFCTVQERIDFWTKLLGPSFDAQWRGERVGHEHVEQAINNLFPSNEHIQMIWKSYEDLEEVCKLRREILIVASTGTVLDAILLNWFLKKYPNDNDRQNELMKMPLGGLLKETKKITNGIPEAVFVAFDLVHQFRNKIHVGNQLRQEYKVTPRVALILRNLLDIAIIEWASGDNNG